MPDTGRSPLTRRDALVPALVDSLRGYTAARFLADLGAGIIVGIVALPLAIAFGIASGVTPERGLATAIVAGFLISALGGSRVQIGGPTGAFVVIVAGVVERFGVDGLLVATFMAGVMLVVFGLVRAGAVIRFVPQPLVTGFTTGIAVLIFASQVRDALGLRMTQVPTDFVEKARALWAYRDTVSLPAIGVTAATLAILLLWPHVPGMARRVPGPFVALLLVTGAVSLLGLDVDTIGSRFGAMPQGLPAPHLPAASWSVMQALIAPAFTIAMLAAIESLLSAVVADGMTGDRHRSNMELVAQGLANMASPVFGGIPATGAIARTATNIKSGGRTPVAGMVHALVLLAVLLAAGPLATRIPMAALAGILIMVAYHMSEWRTFRAYLRTPASDVAVLVTTFLLTVLVDLTVALQVGMVLAAFLFMHRMARVTNVQAVTGTLDGHAEGAPSNTGLHEEIALPAGVELYEIDGPFFFGAAERFKEAIATVSQRPRALILHLHRVPVIDATAISLLRDLHARCRREGTLLLLVHVHATPLAALDRAGFLDELGRDQVVPSLDAALARIDQNTIA